MPISRFLLVLRFVTTSLCLHALWVCTAFSVPFSPSRRAFLTGGGSSVVMISASSSSASSDNEKVYWNREESQGAYSTSTAPIVKTAKILSLSDPNDSNNSPLEHLPDGAEILQTASSMEEFDMEAIQGANVVFVSHPASREPLAQLLQRVPSIEWVHTRSAGIDFVTSSTLAEWKGTVTNAKGSFSSTLSEYTLMACSFFAKDLPRLLKNKKAKNWEKYDVLELRGASLGIIGYGDIGRACAKLAQAYGMKVTALRRHPRPDPFCDAVYGNDKESLNRIFRECDYILCAAPLTPETRHMIGMEQFRNAKKDAVFINIGRGPICDEPALIEALETGLLKGAALDVFETEPLPTSSPLWEMDNVLLSPHNMDKTATFMKEATEFFVKENLPRFVRGQKLLNPVNPADGY